MRNGRISWAFGLLLAAGCADTTFDLLPPPVETPDAGDGGEGATGEPATGGASGSAAGRSGEPGYAGKPSSMCPPEGCFPGCYPEDGCEPCSADSHCSGPDKRLCVDFKCERCRTNNDCAKGERCDPFTHACAPDCERERCASAELPLCSRRVCTECDPNPQSPLNYCPNGLKCSYLGSCEKCLFTFYDCPDLDRPICSPATWECRKCLSSLECNPGGYPPGAASKVCQDGRCIDEPISSPPSP
jgi:hypothetical protein